MELIDFQEIVNGIVGKNKYLYMNGNYDEDEDEDFFIEDFVVVINEKLSKIGILQLLGYE